MQKQGRKTTATSLVLTELSPVRRTSSLGLVKDARTGPERIKADALSFLSSISLTGRAGASRSLMASPMGDSTSSTSTTPSHVHRRIKSVSEIRRQKKRPPAKEEGPRADAIQESDVKDEDSEGGGGAGAGGGEDSNSYTSEEEDDLDTRSGNDAAPFGFTFREITRLEEKPGEVLRSRLLFTSRSGFPFVTLGMIVYDSVRNNQVKPPVPEGFYLGTGVERTDKVPACELLLRPPPTYDPLMLDDPGLHHGKHQTLLPMAGYLVSITPYVRPIDLKQELNQQFREKFPDIQLTLSKLRSLKKDMVAIGVECDLELSTVALAHAYFEQLVLKEMVNKPNRKILAGVCMLLAFKFNANANMAVTKDMMKSLFRVIEETFKITQSEILEAEFEVYCEGLEFHLHVDPHVLLPLLQKIKDQMQT